MPTRDEIRAAVARVTAQRAGGDLKPVRGKEVATPPPPHSLPCLYEGAVIEFCKTCNSQKGELRHVRNCDHPTEDYDRCTRGYVSDLVRSCDKCSSYRAFAPVTTRHLLYHVYPRRNSTWRERVLRLRERIGLFNGRKIIAVATDLTTDGADHVEDALAGTGCELVTVRNDPTRREVATFLPLFETLSSLTEPGHATLYAHAKGVCRPKATTCHRWAEVLEDVMMGDWPAVSQSLERHPVTGCFKKTGNGWSMRQTASMWHYSGSFYWFHNSALFTKNWRKIDQFQDGIEPYPSLHFSAQEAGCLLHTASVGEMNLYNSAYWNGTVEPKVAARVGGPRSVVRVELGGGDKPRGAGWVNVDRSASADVRLDLERDRLPWADGTVDELYSSHTFEHVSDLKHLLGEVVRVAKVGAAFEMRVPHWLSEMALCHGHQQAIGEEQIDHWCRTAVPYWFGGCARRLKHVRTERVPSAHFAEAKRLFTNMTDDQILRFVPNAAHELRFHFQVVTNDAPPEPFPPNGPGGLLPWSTWDHVFGPLVGKRVGFVPTSGGEGDHLIEAATFQLLAHFGIKWTVGPDPTADVILVAGGGSMGAPHYHECAATRSRALVSGPPVWVLPSSWFAPDPDRTRYAKLFARDPVSQSHAPGSILAHDLALGLSANGFGAPEVESGLFLRQGVEGLFTDVPCDGDPVSLCSVSCSYLTLAAKYGHIVTDRRHLAIAGLIAGRKVTLLPNHNHYNRAIWEHSLAALGCEWADKPR